MRRLLSVPILLMIVVLPGCYKGKGRDNIWGIKPVKAGPAEQPSGDKTLRPVAATPAETVPFAVEKPASAKPNLVAVSEPGSHIVSMTYPSADYGIIQLDKTMPREAALNESFDYSIEVTNLTNISLTDVVITEDLPNDFEFIGASPIARKDGNKLVWKIDSLAPKASRQITISGRGTDMNHLEHCTTVTHAVQVRARVRVVQPQLELTKTAPTEVLLCDPIPVEFVVTNSGTGTAQNVKIIDTLSAGLQTVDGRNEIVIDVGTLAAGQSQHFSSQLRATKTGIYVNKAMVSSASGMVAESMPTVTNVRQPKLKIVKTGPKRQYLGRPLAYEIMISNEGDGPAKNTIIEETIPAGVGSIEATAGAKISGTKLVWQLDTLAPNASRKVRVSYIPTTAGTLTNSATATAYCAETVTASMSTSVAGIAAVHMEVIDLEDPIEVGSRTTYLITVTNQGSASDTNIRIVCALEDKIRYVSSSGATVGSIMGNTVSFAPLHSLAPKARATWRVVVRGVRPGDVRFRVTMSSDQLARPVEQTEATHLYE
ncbi:MAG: hypothetical protein ACE5NM_09510 [Sedimentisphaerales bacterium]